MSRSVGVEPPRFPSSEPRAPETASEISPRPDEELLERASRIRRWLDTRVDDMVQMLEQFARLESPTQEPESLLPVFDALGERLEALGLRPHRTPGRETGGCFVAFPRRRSKGCRVQLLLGHADTVWPRSTVETMPVRRDGDLLYGPGVYDMKGGLVIGVWALAALHALEGGLEDLEVPPVFLVNSDEETGSEESERQILRLARVARRVFVLEPSLGAEGRLKTTRKGIGHFEIRIRGRAAHAGLDPEKGASAILELSHVVQRLFALSDPDRGTTVNVGRIDGGLRTNVVAPESRAWVDVRVPDQGEAERVEAEIRSLTATTPGTALEISGGFERPAMEPTPGNRALWHLARERAVALGFELQEGRAGGASDGNLTSPLVPTLDGLGPVGEGAHAEHEQVHIPSLTERAALLALLLAAPAVPPLTAPRTPAAGASPGSTAAD